MVRCRARPPPAHFPCLVSKHQAVPRLAVLGICRLLYKLRNSCASFDLTELLKTEKVKTYLILLVNRDAESEPEPEPVPEPEPEPLK